MKIVITFVFAFVIAIKAWAGDLNEVTKALNDGADFNCKDKVSKHNVIDNVPFCVI